MVNQTNYICRPFTFIGVHDQVLIEKQQPYVAATTYTENQQKLHIRLTFNLELQSSY